MVISNKTYTIPYPVNASDVGCYKCVAVHRLGNKSSDCKYLSPDGKIIHCPSSFYNCLSEQLQIEYI
jgi:hypothetical protein